MDYGDRGGRNRQLIGVRQSKSGSGGKLWELDDIPISIGITAFAFFQLSFVAFPLPASTFFFDYIILKHI